MKRDELNCIPLFTLVYTCMQVYNHIRFTCKKKKIVPNNYINVTVRWSCYTILYTALHLYQPIK